MITRRARRLESAIVQAHARVGVVCVFWNTYPVLFAWLSVASTLKNISNSTKILREIPRHYRNVYIICDTYADRAIKGSEKDLRGNADEFVIRNTDIQIPPNFRDFTSNGTNKERLFEVLEIN